MSLTRKSFALLGLGLGAALVLATTDARSAAAQAGADKNPTDKAPAADTSGTAKTSAADKSATAAHGGKAKPGVAVADGAEPKTKVAKKSKKGKAKPEDQAASATNEPPVPTGSAAVDAAARARAAAGGGSMPTVREANATPVATTGDPNAAAPVKTTAATKTPAAPGTGGAPKPTSAPVAAAAKTGPKCTLDDPEQPRGGRLDVVGTGFGPSPLVRVAGKPVRMIERREDRISVQVPADSDGGMVAVQAQGVLQPCGNLVIIGKNR